MSNIELTIEDDDENMGKESKYQMSEIKNRVIGYSTSPITLKKYVIMLLALFIGVLTLSLIIVASVKSSSNNDQSDSNTPKTTIYQSSTTGTTEDPFGPGPWQNDQLGNDTTPLHYDILIAFYKDNSYDGQVTIDIVNNLEDNDKLVLHGSSLLRLEDPEAYFVSETSGDQENNQLAVKSSFQYFKHDYYVIIFNQKMRKNDRIRLKIQFERRIGADQNDGIFTSTYLDSDGLKK